MNRPPGRLAALVLVAAAITTACGVDTAPEADGPGPNVVQLARENVATAEVRYLSSGPAVSGQLTPAREATVRAQVGGSVESLLADRGQAVRQGAVLARISSRDLEDSLASARAALRSSETALTVTKSEQQRTETLVKGGALAARDLEQARNSVANAEAVLASAKSRETSILQQLDDTTVRAPFSGVVSDRPASLGDVVAPGAPIVTVIDPSSMRLEALVPSDQIAAVRPGAAVDFRIRGFPNQTFTGAVERISPTADPVTRQVAIFVKLPNVEGKLIAGLFTEGRVTLESRRAVVVPLSAIDETGPVAVATRIRAGKAERVVVELGIRQTELEIVEVVSGLEVGDVVVVGSAKGLAPGTPVNVIG